MALKIISYGARYERFDALNYFLGRSLFMKSLSYTHLHQHYHNIVTTTRIML